ncbi:hypothetical protein LL06_00910 [Hoeflea sp. BAL378]|uniref:hypothetical protein n=1 Tax=Hoeflea sp. BAL378 TaxID=1547437 RepID=UPI0005133564|nr:hypothetical protein [Hoeflea sp. BAL378]KGF71184.1 hypothetical protein LL06_00910 [Hoeflea sp. BAL378]
MQIRDASILIGALEGGELNQSFSAEMAKVLQELHTLSTEDVKKSHKGEVSLTISLAAENGTVQISADIKSKTPKRPRARTFYWITEQGALSTEHPQQTDMFSGPRDTKARTAEPAV